MISFYSRPDFQTTDSQWISSSLGYAVLLPGDSDGDPNARYLAYRMRSPFDFILTSKTQYFAGDRTCSHRQIDAEFTARPEYSVPGQVMSPYSYDDFCARVRQTATGYTWAVPENGLYFSASEASSGNKIFISDPHLQYQIGTGRKMYVLFTPGAPKRFTIAYSLNNYVYLSDYTFSWDTLNGRNVCLCEERQLSKRASSAQWTAVSVSDTVYGISWKTGGGNYVCGLGATDAMSPPIPIPAARYPGGVKPNPATVFAQIQGGVIDAFNIKHTLASLMQGYAHCLPLRPMTITYSRRPSDDQLALLREQLQKLAPYAESIYKDTVTEYEWAELANTCVDGCQKIDINGLAYIKEGIELIAGIVTSIKTGQLPKMTSISDLWLSTRYGLRLTAIDTASIVHAAKNAIKEAKSNYRVTHAQSTSAVAVRGSMLESVERSLRYKLYYNRHDDPVVGLLRTIADWDLWPSTKNIWDLIPFSFVVDWFVDVQSQLELIDNAQYTQFLNILSVLFTEKWVYTFKPSSFGFWEYTCDKMTMTYYHRRHSSSPHYAPLRLGSGHMSNINWIDGVTLILQKAGK